MPMLLCFVVAVAESTQFACFELALAVDASHVAYLAYVAEILRFDLLPPELLPF